MEKDAKQKVIDYLGGHLYLNLATVSQDGSPLSHTVGYVSDGAQVYFVTDKKSRKAKNIMGNPSVAYTVDEDYTDLTRIKGVQMKGKANLVTDSSVIAKILDGMGKKFPQMKEMPANPDYVFFRIVPEEAYFIDNSVGFGHRDHVDF
jgi:general stress protein 26